MSDYRNFAYKPFKKLYKADWHFRCSECQEVIKVPFKEAPGGFYVWQVYDRFSDPYARGMYCSTECIAAVQKDYERRSGYTHYLEVMSQEPPERLMDNDQAIGYLLLACRNANQPARFAEHLANQMAFIMSELTEEEANKKGFEWLKAEKEGEYF